MVDHTDYEHKKPFPEHNYPILSIGTTKILDELIEKLGEESPIGKVLLETREYTRKASRLEQNQPAI